MESREHWVRRKKKECWEMRSFNISQLLLRLVWRLRIKAGKHKASWGNVYYFDGTVFHTNASRKGVQWCDFPSSEPRLSLHHLYRHLPHRLPFFHKWHLLRLLFFFFYLSRALTVRQHLFVPNAAVNQHMFSLFTFPEGSPCNLLGAIVKLQV